MAHQKESQSMEGVHSEDMPQYLIYKPFSWVCRKEDFSLDRSIFQKPLEPEWMDVDHINNCFGMPVVDCRYNRKRKVFETLEQHRSMLTRLEDYLHKGTRKITLDNPLDAISVICRLKYPFYSQNTDIKRDAIKPGVLFLPVKPGDFWTAIATSKRIVFHNARTGRLLFNAHYQKKEDLFMVDRFDFDGMLEEGNCVMATKILDFMIKTFIFKLMAPAPLPYSMDGDPHQILNYTFAKYGAHGCFATFHETLKIDWDDLYERNIFL